MSQQLSMDSLINMTKKGDVKRIKEFVNNQRVVNQRDQCNKTLLHYCLITMLNQKKKGLEMDADIINYDVIRFLVASGYDVNIEDPTARINSPFSLALLTRCTRTIQLILDSGSLEIRNITKNEALQPCLVYGDVEDLSKMVDGKSQHKDMSQKTTRKASSLKFIVSVLQNLKNGNVFDKLPLSHCRDLIVISNTSLPHILQVIEKLDASVIMNLYLIGGLSQSEELSLNHSLISFRLQTACLCDLQISKFPKSILQMAQTLRVLRLSNNAICRLPHEIAELVHLRILCLDFQSPKLRSLPQSISNLKELQILNLSGNKLENVNFLSDLTNLEELRLKQNRITELPSSMLEMKKLRVFDISYNPIKRLPACLWSLFKSLKLFEYYNSVLMPKETRRDLNGCLEYLELKHFLSKQSSDSKDIVIAVVGGSGSGRRSLVAALMDDHGLCRQEFKGKNENHFPDSIEVESFEETDESGKSHFITTILLDVEKVDFFIRELWFDAVILTIDLTVFETQNELQFVLTTRHLTALELWLETLEELYPDTPVLLVGTKSEQVKSSSTFSLILKSLEELLDKERASHIYKFSNRLCSTCFLCTSKTILSRCLNVKTSSKFNISCIDFSLGSTYGTATAACFMNQSSESANSNSTNSADTSYQVNSLLAIEDSFKTSKSYPHVVGYYEIDSKKYFPRESKKQNPCIEYLKKAIFRHFASDNCLYSLRKNESNIPENWLAFIKHLNSICKSRNNGPPLLAYDEIVSICRSFDIVFWQIPLLLRYCQKRGQLIVLESSKLSLKYILINLQWLRKLEFKIMKTVENEFVDKVYLKKIVFENIKTEKFFSNLDFVEPASLNHLIRNRLCLNGFCFESSSGYYLFPHILKMGEPHSSVWTSTPEKYEKQITYELCTVSNRSEIFTNIIDIVISEKGKNFLQVLDEPLPVIYQRQIVCFIESNYDSCDDCREMLNESHEKVVLISRSKECLAQETYVNSKYHKIKFSLNHKRDKLRVCVRGSKPCCIMKRLIEFLYLHIEDWIDCTRPSKINHILYEPFSKLKKTATKASRSCDANFDTDSENTYHYVLCPKCVIFQKSNPRPIFFRGVSIKRKPVCDYWHHLGSWARAVTGNYKTIPLELIVNEFSEQPDVPDYEVPRLIIILPPSQETCKMEWMSRSYVKFMEGFDVHFLCESPNQWHLVDGCCFRLTASMCADKENKDQLTKLINLAFLLVQIIQGGSEFSSNLKLLIPIANLFMDLPEYSGVFEQAHDDETSVNFDKSSYDSYNWLMKNRNRLVSFLTKILMTLGDGLPDLFFKSDQNLNSESIFQVPTYASRKDIADFFNLDLVYGSFSNLRPIYLGRELRWVCSKHYYDLHSNSSLKYFN